jgi:methionyl aminopeptidase
MLVALNGVDAEAGQIEIKSPKEIALMKEAGAILAVITTELVKNVGPGVTTQELDDLARDLIESNKVKAAFLGYRNFPAAICASLNKEVVHGIPSTRRKVKSGDLLKIDIGIYHRGFYADQAISVPVGKISAEARKLVETTKEALARGIESAREGNRLGDISWAVQQYVESRKFSVVREYTGHGIGRKIHEPPQVPNFGKAGTGARLRAGMALAIEPMVNAGTWKTVTLDDGWTVVTEDGKLSAHFEHTILITKDGPSILTDLDKANSA